MLVFTVMKKEIHLFHLQFKVDFLVILKNIISLVLFFVYRQCQIQIVLYIDEAAIDKQRYEPEK
jgi:hypothetical protein